MQKNEITVSLRVNGNRRGEDESFIAWPDLPGGMSTNLGKNKEVGGGLDTAPLNLWSEIETLFKCSIKWDPLLKALVYAWMHGSKMSAYVHFLNI